MNKKLKVVITSLIIILAGGFIVGNKVIYSLKNEDTIKKYAEEYKVDPKLMAAIINNESGFREFTDYTKDGKNGLIQVRDYTAADWAKKMNLSDFQDKDILKTDLSIKMEAWYLSNSYNKQNSEDAIKSWVVRNVKEGNELDNQEIEGRVNQITKEFKGYKLFHPFLGK
ncbi:transglycosylase SLT domain-containing protein [Clostridium uliginosum]|uniref:Transglycosylase SLT domain-containing protein n=1 Tax=Clostridium uliginosum TaxID=119641 RepID=A0A1I1M910_9CLOT|nr:transglycosylase SLT domain-containing protein [Clostridium uliginosum]SFC78140.1 Transglycosylase SLT domain-containing protein [Clostridium uliginosum]